jgi:hypothetical protein
MALNAQQNSALIFQLERLLEASEPAAFLATLHRTAERKAYAAARASDRQGAEQWQELASACARVSAELSLTDCWRPVHNPPPAPARPFSQA